MCYIRHPCKHYLVFKQTIQEDFSYYQFATYFQRSFVCVLNGMQDKHNDFLDGIFQDKFEEFLEKRATETEIATQKQEELISR